MAVNQVAIVPMISTERAAPPVPNAMAAHMTNGRTAKARTCVRTGKIGRSPNTKRHAAVRSDISTASSISRLGDWVRKSAGNVKTSGVMSSTPVASPSQ